MIYQPQGIYSTGEVGGGGEIPGQEFTVIRRGAVTMSDGAAPVTCPGLTADSLVFLTPQTSPVGSIFENKVSRDFSDPGNETFTISSTDGAEGATVAYLVINPS